MKKAFLSKLIFRLVMSALLIMCISGISMFQVPVLANTAKKEAASSITMESGNGYGIVNKVIKNIQQWHVAEVTLKSGKKYGNPFKDVEIYAVFSAPDETIIELPGFWDGGNTWKVRFAPTQTGTWTYTVYCTDKKNKELDNQMGKIECVKNTSTLSIYKHGFIRASNNRRLFSYNDGTPFFWLGDTHWGMTESLDKTNYPRATIPSQFKHIVNDRIKKGFTVYQAYPSSLDNKYWCNKYDRLNPQGFRNHLDKQIQHLADNGMVIALGMGWFGDQSFAGQKGMELFAKYMVARYAAYPVVWFTAQEVDINNRYNNPEVWKSVALLIRRYDGYKHPLSGHMQSLGEPKTWGNEPWHDWFATQGGHGGTSKIRTKEHYKSYWDYFPRKPYIETEAMYEGVDAGGAKATAKDVRIAAYKAIQCGSYGYTYGAAGVWRNKWDASKEDAYDHRTPWYVGIDLPGGRELGFLKGFYTSLDWSRLIPRFSDTSWGEFKNGEQAVVSTNASKVYTVYFYNIGKDTGVLKNMDSGKVYTAEWFNPRTGKYTIINDGIKPETGRYNIPQKPDNEDWMLLVRQM
ncbi:MAG: DUF4038 domain-containing protein [Clostridia bacterium]|nr:DUF4038 domain-containing protein [Clostridia bacterium]